MLSTVFPVFIFVELQKLNKISKKGQSTEKFFTFTASLKFIVNFVSFAHLASILQQI